MAKHTLPKLVEDVVLFKELDGFNLLKDGLVVAGQRQLFCDFHIVLVEFTVFEHFTESMDFLDALGLLFVLQFIVDGHGMNGEVCFRLKKQ